VATKEHPLSEIVSSGVKEATAGSLISASFKYEPKAFSARGEAAVKLKGADELRLRQRGGHVHAEILDGGKVVEPRPSGRFKLPGGKTIVLEKGKVVGGDAFRAGKFQAFALLTDFPAEH
jgi:hypothetical protein